MAQGGTSLLGGGSAFCVSQKQVDDARRMFDADPVSSPRLKELVGRLESELSRNERAALAFVLIERLRTQAGSV